ncbi:MAG: hypothetical protein HRF43_02915 [Phycisphaerae bacterium]|jgi:hypothetical protein
MPVQTLFINGPKGGGKSTVARLVATEVLDRPAHYLRTQKAPDDHTNGTIPIPADQDGDVGTAWASRHLVRYTADRVFETLPDALRKVRRIQKRAFVVIEADADPALRHAYPYEYRIFVSGCPREVHEVFRTPQAAAAALQQVMQDTAAFAAEIFGLFASAPLDDSFADGFPSSSLEVREHRPVEHLELSETQVIRFLKTPLGGEIASRIQLQPDYHPMVESDVVLINTGVGQEGDALRECIQRIEKLLARIRHETRRHSVLYWGDVLDKQDPTNLKLLRRLKTLLAL